MGGRSRRKVALVLGSGAARGWAHIGVIRTLQDAGIGIDMVCGSSAGAVVGAAYAAGKLDGLEDWVTGLRGADVLRLLDPALNDGGFLRGTRILKAYSAAVPDQDIQDLEIPFGAVATDIESGHEVWLRRGRLHPALRATCALPGLFPPICIDDRWLADGGLVNPVPVSLARAMEAGIVIAVNLNGDLVGSPGRRHRYARPDDEGASGPGLLQRMQDWWTTHRSGRGLVKAVFSGTRGEEPPGIMSVVADSIHIMQDRITRARLVGEPPDILIAPLLGNMGILEFDRAKEAIDAGRDSTEKVLKDLERVLGA